MQSKCVIEEINMLNRSYEPERRQLLLLAALQHEDGSFPYSYRLGNHEIFPLWFIYTAITYIKETGDFDFLDVVMPLYKHLQAAFNVFYSQLQTCFVPWPDSPDYLTAKKECITLENIITACLLIYVGKDLTDLLKYSGLHTEATETANLLEQITSHSFAFCETEWFRQLQIFYNKRACRCSHPLRQSEYYEEINKFIYSHILRILIHCNRKIASDYWPLASPEWDRKAVTEWILGIKPGFRGLFVDPCIPDTFEAYEVKRYYRNAIYRISVLNPQHITSDVKKLVVDGAEYLGNMLPNFADGNIHIVEVTMGSLHCIQ